MTRRAACFIDLDNAQIAAEKLELRHCGASRLWMAPLLARIEAQLSCTVDIRRAYGNVLFEASAVFSHRVWNPQVIRDRIMADTGYQMDLAQNGVQMVHCPSTGGGTKNRADMQMTLDALEVTTLYPHIDTMIIVSNDSDFSPLVTQLRARGRATVLVGLRSQSSEAARLLRAMFTDYIDYDQTLIDAYGADRVMGILETLVRDHAAELRQGMPIDRLEMLASNLIPPMLHRSLGYGRFADLVHACLDHSRFACVGDRIKLTPPPATKGSDRVHQIAAALTKARARQVPEVLHPVLAYLRAHHFDAMGSPLAEPTLATLRDAAQAHLSNTAADVSRSKLFDVFRTLSESGVLKTDSRDLPMEQARVLELCGPEEIPTRLIQLAKDRLMATQFELTVADADALAEVVLGGTRGPELTRTDWEATVLQ